MTGIFLHPLPVDGAFLRRRCERIPWHLARPSGVAGGDAGDFDETPDLEEAILQEEGVLDAVRLGPAAGRDDILAKAEATRCFLAEGRTVAGGVAIRDGFAFRLPLFLKKPEGYDVVRAAASFHVREGDLDRLLLARLQTEAPMPAAFRFRAVTMLRRAVRDDRSGGVFRHGEINAEDLDRRLDAWNRFLRDLAMTLAASVPPPVPQGSRCENPGPCPFQGACGFGERHGGRTVYALHRGRTLAESLVARGVERLEDVGDDEPLSAAQRVQVDAARSGRLQADVGAIREFLGTLRFPLVFLDFEAWQTHYPRFPGMRVLQVVPFQFSAHLLAAPDAEPRAFRFLAPPREDPRPLFLDALRAVLPAEGSVVAFNIGFESSRLQELAEEHPDHADWIRSARDRMVDLWDPFRRFQWYHPRQLGKTGVKTLLPLLGGKETHADLAVADGREASQLYLRTHFRDVGAAAREDARRALEAYCALDSWALVLLWRALRKAADEPVK